MSAASPSYPEVGVIEASAGLSVYLLSRILERKSPEGQCAGLVAICCGVVATTVNASRNRTQPSQRRSGRNTAVKSSGQAADSIAYAALAFRSDLAGSEVVHCEAAMAGNSKRAVQGFMHRMRRNCFPRPAHRLGEPMK